MGTKLLLTILAAIQRLMGLIAGLFARLSPEKYAPQLNWPSPTGAHAVGIVDTVLDITERTDPHHQGHRRLPLKVWYPAATINGYKQRPLINDTELPIFIRGMTKAMPVSAFMVQRIGGSLTNAYQDAPVANGPFPILLFNEGFAGTISQNSHLAEEIASQGYIVISVDHPGGASASAFPDGSGHILNDDLRGMMMSPDLMRPAMAMKRSKTFAERYEALKGYLAFAPLEAEGRIWVDDLTNVMDALDAKKVPSPLLPILEQADLGKIAIAGMSFGGAASAAFAHQDNRVTCAINLDGGQFGSELLEQPIRCPLLMVHSSFATFTDGGGYNDFFYSYLGTADDEDHVARYVIDQTGHIDFTDMTIFGHGPVAKLLGLGGIEGSKMLTLTATLVSSFLSTHLKGGADNNRFDGTSLMATNPNLRQQDMTGLHAWRRTQ